MQIVFHDDGRIEFTRNPDLLKAVEGLGRLSISRMTDILFDEDMQRFYIWFRKGPHEGRPLAITLPHYNLFAHDYGGPPVDDFQVHTEHGGFLSFATYEDAVATEVRYVEFLRDMGYSMT
jgi:hypothetical protein